MITAKLEKIPVLKAVVTKPYQGKGYAEGYEVGHAQGYTEGEQTAKAEAEAANAVILADCNAVLPTKGVETAETLEQVPQRIGEIQSYADGYDVGYEQGKIDGNLLIYGTTFANLFNGAVFPDGYEITITAPNALSGATIGYMFKEAKGVRKITMNIPTGAYSSAHSFIHGTAVEELILPDGIRLGVLNNFASNVKTLKSVFGRIDASGSANNSSAFSGCSALENVSFVQNTIFKSLHIGHSPNLTDASIQSIIDGLADLTGQTAQTLTFHRTVGEKLTDAQKATITAKNWTLVY